MTKNTVIRLSFRRRRPELQGTCTCQLILIVGIAFGFGSLDSAKAQAPAFAWAAKIGGGLDQGGSSIAVDAAGNSYVAGVFLGTATFGTTSLTSHGEEDAFLAKYDASGNLLWAKRGGGSYEDFIFGNAVDGAGNCYVSGAFDGQATFGNITLTNKVDPSGQNGFIAKYDSAGNVLWAIQISGTENNVAIGIAVDSSGNVYATGDFAGTADFGSTSLTSNAGGNDIFVAKYGSDGNLIW